MKVILILRMLISVPTIYCYEKPKHAKVMKKTIHSKYSTHRTKKENVLLVGDEPASPECLAWQESVPKACGF